MLLGAMVHPTIMVSDMARSRAFYEGRLGLEVVRETAPYLFLRAGSGQLALVARATVTPPATTTCAFEVDDLAPRCRPCGRVGSCSKSTTCRRCAR